MPDALKTEREEIEESDWIQIQTVIKEGLNNILNFRKDEGASLEKEFQLRIRNIHLHDQFLHLSMIRFRSHGVNFATHFLGNET